MNNNSPQEGYRNVKISIQGTGMNRSGLRPNLGSAKEYSGKGLPQRRDYSLLL
jgi:hypothetical protein